MQASRDGITACGRVHGTSSECQALSIGQVERDCIVLDVRLLCSGCKRAEVSMCDVHVSVFILSFPFNWQRLSLSKMIC